MYFTFVLDKYILIWPKVVCEFKQEPLELISFIHNLTGLPRYREIGYLKVYFSRQGKHREFDKNIKDVSLHREFTTDTGKI